MRQMQHAHSPAQDACSARPGRCMQMRMMLPLMDLFNHANADEANINMFKDDNGDYVGYAKRDIKKGEQANFTTPFLCSTNPWACPRVVCTHAASHATGLYFAPAPQLQHWLRPHRCCTAPLRHHALRNPDHG